MKRRVAAAAGKLAPLCIALAVLSIVTGTAWACPGCKDALAANDNQGGNLVAGYFWSILFMMSMPFILVGTFGGSMYLSVRRARASKPRQRLSKRRRLWPHPSKSWSKLEGRMAVRGFLAALPLSSAPFAPRSGAAYRRELTPRRLTVRPLNFLIPLCASVTLWFHSLSPFRFFASLRFQS